jgi:hypothetical protein
LKALALNALLFVFACAHGGCRASVHCFKTSFGKRISAWALGAHPRQSDFGRGEREPSGALEKRMASREVIGATAHG